jgi:hypothetical protein
MLNNINKELKEVKKEINFFNMEKLFPNLCKGNYSISWHNLQIEQLESRQKKLRHDKSTLQELLYRYNY